MKDVVSKMLEVSAGCRLFHLTSLAFFKGEVKKCFTGERKVKEGIKRGREDRENKPQNML